MGLPLNVICLNAAMSVLARSGRWYEALDLLSKMRRRALLVDVGADAEQGKRKPAGGALLARDAEEEEEEGVAGAPSGLVLPQPDAITFNAAISGEFSFFFKSERAWGWVRQERREGSFVL